MQTAIYGDKVQSIAVVESGLRTRCVNGARRIKDKNKAYATKITDVVKTRTRDRRDVIREGKMRKEK